jgi:hypothetical protein
MVETQVGTDKQLLSTHFLIFITPRVHAIMQTIVMHYFRTAKRAKRNREFNAGVLIKKNGLATESERSSLK